MTLQSMQLADGQRFGFNGHEKDDEINGSGNFYDMGMRCYDPRTARMFQTDPRAGEYPWQTTYAYHRNSPITTIDFLGGGGNTDGTYTVEENDNLTKIANLYHTTVKAIKEANTDIDWSKRGENQDIIRIGEKLKIPTNDYEAEKVRPDITRRSDTDLSDPVGNDYTPVDNPEKFYNYIAVHHSGNTDSPTLKEVQQQHLDEGWHDIGYHFAIDLSGNIYEARSIFKQGASVGPADKNGVIGIVILGDFQSNTVWDWSNDKLTDEAQNALTELVTYLSVKYSISFVGGHQDIRCNHTDCPGNQVMDIMDEVRESSGTTEPDCLYTDENWWDF